MLVGLWLWFAFSYGGYSARQWLPLSLVLGLLGLVVSLLAAYPRRPRQLSLTVLALFGCYSVWVAFSALWADSTTRVWMESGRTFSYLLIFALALVYFTDPAARRAFPYLLMAGALLVLAVCVWKLWSGDSIVWLFHQSRFYYPVSYTNNAAALFLVAFWPLMWLAAGPEERAPIRGAALGLATGLLALAIMTQSRGAVWSLAISLVIMFVVSPARMRTLIYLLVPGLLMVYGFPILNRYWLEGPEAVGGDIGARTLVVTAVTAAFIGMILALLERWVKVAGRTKVVFNTVVTLAAIVGLVYGSITLTSDVGGPLKSASQTWQQFFGQTTGPSEASSTSRLLVVSDSGRVDLWRVAWQEFEQAPVLGVGADNYVFQYDRSRALELTVQQAHSFELQVLGETGLVGGFFAFGGILLALGGLLWPRCTAGWRGARETWLRRRRQADASTPTGASVRCCNPRWGSSPVVYGWEMALLAGAAYWLIHASVDWLWQMPGVTIPAVLFVAAGVAGVDARAGVLWPRVNRWLRFGAPATPPEPLQTEVGEIAVEPVGAGDASQADGLLMTTRRSDQYAAKARRRERRAARRERSAARIQPPGLLSHVFRALLVTLSLVVIVVAGLPYLSLLYQDSAMALARTDGVRAVDRAGAARWFQLTDPGPYLTQAGIYSSAASAAAASDAGDRAGAVLDNLALSIDRLEAAIALEPADWSLHYRAGVAALNLLLARQYAAGLDPGLDYETAIPKIPGLEDWSALVDSSDTLPEPGLAAGSLAATADTRGVAASYRGLAKADLAHVALDFLSAARERNPLASQTAEATEIVREIRDE